MRYLYILLFFVACLLTSCSDDDKQVEISDIKIGEEYYQFNMPLISNDIEEVKEYLKGIDAPVVETTQDDIHKIETILTVKTNDLFLKAIYSYKVVDSKVDYFNVALVYNGVTPNEETKKYVTDFLTKKTLQAIE